jgi:2'-5' RNA ligase
MADARRLFFALWPDPMIRSALAQAREQPGETGGRLTHAEDLHITCVFLGVVDKERQACVESVADALHAQRFELQIDHFGYWPRPRILWCGSSETPRALKELVHDLQQGLAECGFEPEFRPYTAHVTLGRKVRRMRLPKLEPPISWPVRDLCLVASRLGGKPPRYEVVRRWELACGAG